MLLGTQAVALGTLYVDKTLLYTVTHEDGLVEWMTVVALLALAGVCFFLTPKHFERRLKVLAYGLGLLSIIAAGEEISWGQRIFGFEASESFKQLNHQNETNLHNLLPAELFNGVIIFGVAYAFALLPALWRVWKKTQPWWLPSEELCYFTLAAVSVNHYRVPSVIENVGLVFIIMMILVITLIDITRKKWKYVSHGVLGLLSVVVLYHCRFILPSANGPYEIRELLIIVLVIIYCRQLQNRDTEAPE